MGLKGGVIMPANKLTLDLTPENKDTLDRLKKEQRLPYGTTINTLISTFATLPKDVNDEMLEFAKLRLKLTYRMMDGAGTYNLRDLYKKAQAYSDVAAFLNGGETIPTHEIEKMCVLRKLPFAGGILLCPDDWIIVNPERAKDSEYVCVIECRNATKHGIPHLVFFSTQPFVREYSESYTSYVYDACIKAWPKFKEILGMQVPAIPDPNRPGQLLNEDEWCGAPLIGLYDVYVQGDPAYPADYKPPYGTRILKEGGTENAGTKTQEKSFRQAAFV